MSNDKKEAESNLKDLATLYAKSARIGGAAERAAFLALVGAARRYAKAFEDEV